ncbi:MAG TPA: hypothetical protein VLE72_04235 [Candidatus Saccharimonadales bacterium]|nr:hypothetical protein [Candidatus Saccharimonadales bacterium]
MTLLHIYPINAAYILGGTVLVALVIWGVSSYRKVPAPITKYFILSGIGGAVFFYANSIPYLFTENLNALRLATNIGDIGYYGLVLVLARIIWYIGFYKRFNFLWLFLPTLALSLVVYCLYVINIWNTTVVLENGALTYSWPTLALRLDALLSIVFVVASFYIYSLSRASRSLMGKLRSFGLATIVLSGGVSGLYNTLVLRGQNNSPTVYGVYIVVFSFFFGTVLLGRRHRTPTNPT